MPFQRRNTPTLEGVIREIQALESLYGIDTEAYLMHDCRSSHVDEDDGMQWTYLYEQLRVLREGVVEAMYSTRREVVLLENFDDSPELLAA